MTASTLCELLAGDVAAVVQDLDCFLCESEADCTFGLVATIEHAVYEGDLPDSLVEPTDWVQAAIRANPGTWTTRLCRAKHGLPEMPTGLAYCGLCADFANPRKRARDANRRRNLLLPGFEHTGGAYRLHLPCSRRGLAWLRHLVYRLRASGWIETRRERQPDPRNHRGWDFMCALYPAGQTDRTDASVSSPKMQVPVDLADLHQKQELGEHYQAVQLELSLWQEE